uniref:Uncharacterized protein n=1 Tax=Parascaris equorum TaxID=6256 RepID=A0A914R5W8_PAREQ
MFVGPRFPHDSVIYTTDPYLPCQSRFCNPRSIVRNSAHYENTITAIREAVIRSESNLAAGSPEFEHAKSVDARWHVTLFIDHVPSCSNRKALWAIVERLLEYDAVGVEAVVFLDIVLPNEVRGTDENDDHIVMNQRGEAVFERPEHFSSVIEVMIRRAVANMADTDSDVARELRSAYGEFETFNYSITPIVNTSMRAIGLPVPMIGPVELESLSADIEIVASIVTVVRSSWLITDSEGDVDILEMVRALSNLMQSGFINLVLVMAYELLQVPELLHLFAGDFSAIYNNRVQIRRFIIENVFNDNSRPSEEDINSAAERVTLAESELDRFLSYDDVHRYAEVAGDQPSGTRDRQVVRWLSHMSVTHIRELLSRGTPFGVENMHDDFVVLPSETGDQPQTGELCFHVRIGLCVLLGALPHQSSSSGRNDERAAEMANDVVEGGGDLADRVEDTAWRMALPQVVFLEFLGLYEVFRGFEALRDYSVR